MSSGEQVVSRIFVSHSSRDNRQAVALVQWLSQQRPELANEIFLDISADTGLRPGQRWKDALREANDRCEAVICLLSRNWESSPNCKTEYLTAENLGKQILVARLEDLADTDITAEWQRCDLFAEGAQTEIAVSGGAPVRFNTAALDRLKKAIEGSGIGPENFVWPPSGDRRRAPYRGWEPFEDIDAGVFFGRDAAIVRGTDELRAMRISGLKSLFVVLGPSGSGKSSFLRAGLIPRLQRDDRHFRVLGIVRPERNPLTGDQGLAAAIHTARQALHLRGAPLGEIKNACLNDATALFELLGEVRTAARRSGWPTPATTGGARRSLVLPLDQAEELFSADAGPQAEQFLALIADLMRRLNTGEVGLMVAATIRTDRYEAMQNHPALDGVGTVLFNELKPMPPGHFSQVITGPAARASHAGQQLKIAPDLVNRLLEDATEGADTLPLLALTLARLYADYATNGELTSPTMRPWAACVMSCKTRSTRCWLPPPGSAQISSICCGRRLSRGWPPSTRTTTNRCAGWPATTSCQRQAGPLSMRWWTSGCWCAMSATARWWSRLRWKACCANGMTWPAGCARSAKTSRPPTTSNATPPPGTTHDHDPAWLLTGTRLTDAETLASTPGFSDRLAGTHDYLAASRQAENQRWPKKKNNAKPSCVTPRNANTPPKPTRPTCETRPHPARPSGRHRASSVTPDGGASRVGFAQARPTPNTWPTRALRDAIG